MRRTYLLVFLCLILSLASCNKKDDSIIFYTADEIYLNCVEYGNVISGFPKGLLIFESEEQLEYALNEYECIGSMVELDTIMGEYPIGEYIYLLQYFETEYDSKVVCKGLNVDKEEMRIHLEHKIKSPQESPTAIKAYVTYAVLPKEYLSDCDFSNQQGVLYLGKTADINQMDENNLANENPGSEAVEPPEILDLDSFEKIAELKSMLEEEEDIVADYLDSNNYSMNGLRSKEDIAELFNEIGDLTMFHMDSSSGYRVVSIIYYPTYDYVLSTYSNGRQSDTLRFVCYIGASDETDTSNRTGVSEVAVSYLCIGDENVALYKVEENCSHALVGRTETANSRITILFFDDNEETIRDVIEGHIVIATFLDLVEEYSMAGDAGEMPPIPTVAVPKNY